MSIARLGLAFALAAAGMQDQPFNHRPASVTITIANSHNLYDGTFTASSTAAVCGVVPKDRNFSGEDSFIVQFPDGADLEVQDVTFASNELAGKATTTAKFSLSVTVKNPRIGSPHAYVLDPSRPKQSGVATLSSTPAGVHVLKITGSDELGATISLTLNCSPRKKGER